MKNFKILAASILAASLLAALPAYAQGSMTAPIVVRSAGSKTSGASAKGNWLKAEVIHADSNSMIVRERNNGMMVHTFTYTPELQAAMQKLMNQGGYQYGDKVQILYQQGQSVALRLRGKPSKAL
jgi:hypothetical protein